MIVENMDNKEIQKIIFVLFFFYSIIMDICKLSDLKKIFAVQLPITSQYVMYVFLGYYLDKIKVERKKLILFDLFGIFMMLIVSLMGYRMDTVQYNDVPTVILSICIFLTFKYKFDYPINKIEKFITKKHLEYIFAI
ncbi:hypothetical protein KQI69_01380 [Eubacterium sp. MSJ-13]|uniref:hypothetical protein n=1 Tax=Eubacterium sp. MSJ-13 TaxID=2841513 RepID=UPI001C0FEF76|nr:hypothetical protein [Eubacterium sp. MSJ-13]MBU5477851.1 hypothetical protein [Eubacterium sp. MSJ-13]